MGYVVLGLLALGVLGLYIRNWTLRNAKITMTLLDVSRIWRLAGTTGAVVGAVVVLILLGSR